MGSGTSREPLGRAHASPHSLDTSDRSGHSGMTGGGGLSPSSPGRASGACFAPSSPRLPLRSSSRSPWRSPTSSGGQSSTSPRRHSQSPTSIASYGQLDDPGWLVPRLDAGVAAYRWAIANTLPGPNHASFIAAASSALQRLTLLASVGRYRFTHLTHPHQLESKPTVHDPRLSTVEENKTTYRILDLPRACASYPVISNVCVVCRRRFLHPASGVLGRRLETRVRRGPHDASRLRGRLGGCRGRWPTLPGDGARSPLGRHAADAPRGSPAP